MKYEVRHTVDESGARCMSPEGWHVAYHDSLDKATEEAEELTAKGQAGYVRRLEDGATLAPDGSWVGGNKIRATFQLEPGQLERLRARAREDDISQSEIVRRALDAYFL